MKKLLLTLLAAAVTLAAAAGGISSAAELAAFAEAVNAGGDIAAWQDERGEVHLKADIDMSGIKRFARIGNFEGVFDGEGHAILNWKTDGGLFRLVAEGSVVRNLVIAESCSMKVLFFRCQSQCLCSRKRIIFCACTAYFSYSKFPADIFNTLLYSCNIILLRDQE